MLNIVALRFLKHTNKTNSTSITRSSKRSASITRSSKRSASITKSKKKLGKKLSKIHLRLKEARLKRNPNDTKRRSTKSTKSASMVIHVTRASTKSPKHQRLRCLK
jgi:hypothetical protein